MSGQRIIVLEVNEVPPRLFRWYADAHPAGAIAGLVARGGLVETENHDDLGGRELYPSQAWATLAAGVAYERHGVYWYGDPKPAAYPLYWQLAARAGRRVGIVGTLHSSPFAGQSADPNIAFAIPDCFAADADVRPERYRRFQELNLAMTRGSGRVVRARPGARDAITLATAARLGVRPQTYGRLVALAGGVLARRVPRERVRSAQFLLLGDMFLRLVRDADPDLAVLFTNHVAAAMHRYWYASFPGDWDTNLYGDAWIARYRNEIPEAMRSLDRLIGELTELCDATGRALVVCSAIGQRPVLDLEPPPPEVAVVRDPARFLSRLGTPGSYRVLSGMVPQISLSFETPAEAECAAAHLVDRDLTDAGLSVDRRDEVLTVSYHVRPSPLAICVEGRSVPFTEAGITVERTDDQRCADHDPVGSLLVHGTTVRSSDGRVDVRDVAPALLGALGVEPPQWHRSPELHFGESRMVTQ